MDIYIYSQTGKLYIFLPKVTEEEIVYAKKRYISYRIEVK